MGLAALGVLSAALYGAAGPAARWLGLAPLAGHVGVFALLFALYLGALRCALRPAHPRAKVAIVLGFAVLFRLLVVWTPVYLSSDVYRYLWDGRVQWSGVNPYRYPPSAPELQALRDSATHAPINRPTAVTAYPPGAEWLFAGVALVAPGSLPGWRLTLLAVEVGTVVALLSLLRRVGAPAAAVVVYAWSPLVVFEGIQAGHVDLAVIPLVLLALLARLRGSSIGAGLALGGAVLVKVYPLVLLPALWRRRDWRFPMAVGATVAAGYAPYAAGLGWRALGFLPAYFLDRREDSNVGLRALVTYGVGLSGEVPRRVAIVLLLGTVGLALAGIGRRHRDGLLGTPVAATRAVGTWLVLEPFSLHPWYVLWLVPLLCLEPTLPWLYLTGAVTLSYTEYLAHPPPLPWWAWLAEYGPLYGLLAARALRVARPPVASRVAVSRPA